MENKRFRLYYILSLLGVLALSAYPVYMAAHVARLMRLVGSVPSEQFPKYIIPYSPIAFALLCGTALMPLLIKYARRFAFLCASFTSLGIFLAAELTLESQVIVSSTKIVALESWQMYMCYIPPMQYETRTWTAIDVLMGEYSPAFKIHFYLISAALILAILNSLYGFAEMLASGERTRKNALVLQSVSSGAFLGMCILACFTAFYRDGELTVSPLSAALMCAFFMLLGITLGVFTGSFTVGKRKLFSVWIPAAVATLSAFLMYVAEACLLSGHLYRLGNGIFFEPLFANFLSAADVCVILATGAATAALLGCNKRLGKDN